MQRSISAAELGLGGAAFFSAWAYLAAPFSPALLAVPIRSLCLVLLVAVGASSPVAGQDTPIDTTVVAEDPPSTRDIVLLHKIYNVERMSVT